MKGSLKRLLNILLIFIIVISVLNSCNFTYAKSIDLMSYFDGGILKTDGRLNESYFGAGSYDPDKYMFSDNTGIDLSVNYNWLYSFKKMIEEINSTELTAKDIADSNSVSDIEFTQKFLKEIKPIIATFAYSGNDVTEPENWEMRFRFT